MKRTAPASKLPRSFRLQTESTAPAVSNGLALGLSTALLMPLGALAQTTATPAAPAAPASPASEAELPAVKVKSTAIDPNPNAQTGVPYKAKTSADTRHTRPLAETPSTIQVVTKAAIDDAGVTDLKQILNAQPGITLGTGENGNAFGDRYIIRGQEARSDVFVDGLRDPGMSTRESFAIEQLEITKGPSSSFAGRGSAGGAVNAITKQATLDYDFTRLSASVGSGAHQRVSADINKGFSDTFALRANLLSSEEDVPGRSPSSRKREGLALSGLYEINDDLSLTVDYYGLRAKDSQPDLGSYLVGTLPNRVPATNVPVYAQANDFLQSNADTLTARVKYKLSADTTLNSLTRYGTTSNAYATTGAGSRATYYMGTTALPAGTAVLDSGHTGWQDVSYFAHQTNLRHDATVAGLKNEFIFGAELTDHKVRSGNYTVTTNGAFNCSTTSGGANNAFCISGIDGASVNASYLTGRTYAQNPKNQDWHVTTLALSAMDTVDLTSALSAFAGVRADHYKLSLKRYANTGANVGATTADYRDEDTLLNGHLGLSYKLNPQGMVYASMSSAQDINGGEPDSGTSAGYGGLVVPSSGNVSAKPERSTNFELGTKWNLMDERLLATAAAFQTSKRNVMEGLASDAYASTGSYNTGANRVRGVEFGLTGNVTEDFTVQAGLSLMKSKVTDSYTASNVGRRLANFADRSLSLMGKYQVTSKLSLGAAARHESERCGGQPDTAVSIDATTGVCSQPVPSYTKYDLFGSYRFNKRYEVRLNVLNATDKDYYTAVYRSGSFLYKGDARATRLTLNVDL